MPDPSDTGRGDSSFIGRQNSFIGRQDTYDFNYRIFPEDLGQEDMAHYMVININVQTEVSGSIKTKGNLPTGSLISGGLSKVDQLRLGGNGQLDPLGALNNIGGDAVRGFLEGIDIPGFNFIPGPVLTDIVGPAITAAAEKANGFVAPQRRTTRIKESIALHMPNGGLVYTEENKYEEVSMTAVLTGIVAAGAGTVGGSDLFNKTVSAVKRGSQISGYPINPAVEVLFAARPQRQWMFEVFMLPRSENEVKSVREIIRTLRYHAAPEIIGQGFIFSPPAEFDITFFHKGEENKNLPRINTCVLDRIDVDYAPEQSYSTFANGHPIAVRMSLGFREVEILHKQRVFEGF